MPPGHQRILLRARQKRLILATATFTEDREIYRNRSTRGAGKNCHISNTPNYRRRQSKTSEYNRIPGSIILFDIETREMIFYNLSMHRN